VSWPTRATGVEAKRKVGPELAHAHANTEAAAPPLERYHALFRKACVIAVDRNGNVMYIHSGATTEATTGTPASTHDLAGTAYRPESRTRGGPGS
jgi:hypothetical protein